MACIVIAYAVMAYSVMAYIVMAYVVMAYIVIACMRWVRIYICARRAVRYDTVRCCMA